MPLYTKVKGAQGLYLLPSLTSSGGVYKRGGMEFTIATLPGVRAHLWKLTQEAFAKAWGVLGAIRAATTSFGDVTEWVQLSTEMGRVDGYLILTDTKNGQKGALSIEFGRSEYLMFRPRNNLDRVSSPEVIRIKGMEGKAILHRGFGVPLNSLQGTGGGDID